MTERRLTPSAPAETGLARPELMSAAPYARRSESRHGSSNCRWPVHAAPQDDSAGNSSAHKDATRPSPPAGECVSAAGVDPGCLRRRDCADYFGMQQDFLSVGFVFCRIEVARPLPYISDHVVKAMTVGWETADGRCPVIALERRLWWGKMPCQVLAISCPPGVNSSPQANSASSNPPRAANSHSASVGKSLPVHLAYAFGVDKRRHGQRDARTCPLCRFGVHTGCLQSAPNLKVHHCVMSAPVTGRTADRTSAILPSAYGASRRDSPSGRAFFCKRDISGGFDEFREITVGDGCSVNPETIDRPRWAGASSRNGCPNPS